MKMQVSGAIALWIGLWLLVVGGCGPQYREQIADQQGAIGGLEADRLDLEMRLANLNGDRVELRDKIGELEGQLAGQAAYQQALEEELAELGGDQQALTNKYQTAIGDQARIIAEMKQKQASAQTRLETLRAMLERFKGLIAGGKLNVRVRDGKLTLDLPSAVLFPLGQAAISEEGMQTLGAVAGVLAEIEDREFQVAGHTDDLPINGGPFADNWELSAARSMAVVRALEELGVAPRNLSGSGYSMYRPAAPNSSPASRTQNRRIEIVLMPNLAELPDMTELEQELR